MAYIEKTGLEDIIGGYEVITASNGKEGVKAWEEHHPDVIISDIDMPVMNGFEMVERIRETDGEVIIIFTSALTSPNDVKAGYRLIRSRGARCAYTGPYEDAWWCKDPESDESL